MKSKITTIAYLTGAALMFPNTSEAALVNPSFETAGADAFEADGWTKFGSVAREDWADGDGTYADGGGTDFGMALQGWVAAGSGGFYQDSAATVGLEYVFSANMHFEPGFNPSTMQLKLEWFDAGSAFISADIASLLPLTTGSNPGTPAEWDLYNVAGTAPVGTSFVRTVLFFDGTSDIGGNQAGRVDNVSLVAVPEPTSTALLGLGALGFLIRRRR